MSFKKGAATFHLEFSQTAVHHLQAADKMLSKAHYRPLFSHLGPGLCTADLVRPEVSLWFHFQLFFFPIFPLALTFAPGKRRTGGLCCTKLSPFVASLGR